MISSNENGFSSSDLDVIESVESYGLIGPTPTRSETLAMCVTMLQTQHELNSKFVGEQWRIEATAATRINYACAILDEGVELQACDGAWKWWKSGFPAPDTSNMKIELVDLLHFLISQALTDNLLDVCAGDTSGIVDNQDAVKNSIAEVSFRMREGYLFAYGLNDPEEHSDFDSVDVLMRKGAGEYNPVKVRHALHALVSSSLSMTPDYLQGRPAEFSPNHQINWTAFWGVAHAIGMSFADVYSTYVGKACINSLRIANGDKKGEYHRLWWGRKEDNFYLMGYFDSYKTRFGKPPTKTEVEQWLLSAYRHWQIDLGTSTQELTAMNVARDSEEWATKSEAFLSSPAPSNLYVVQVKKVDSVAFVEASWNPPPEADQSIEKAFKEAELPPTQRR